MASQGAADITGQGRALWGWEQAKHPAGYLPTGASPPPPSCCPRMRFKLHAYPRLMGQAKGTFDAISTYKLDREGKIYEHSVDNMQLRDPPITNPLLYGLNLLVGPQAAPQQVPCPGSWFENPAEGSQPPLATGRTD